MAARVQPLTKPPMTEQPRREDRLQRPKPLTDFYGEDRHELVQKVAYQLWEALRSRERRSWDTSTKTRAWTRSDAIFLCNMCWKTASAKAEITYALPLS